MQCYRIIKRATGWDCGAWNAVSPEAALAAFCRMTGRTYTMDEVEITVDTR